MRKLGYFTCMTLALYMLSSLSAVGQERQLELINLDGSAAADSVAVAVIAPGVYLDEQLALPSVDANGNVSIQPVSRQVVPLNASKNGLLPVPAEAKAVVAQNQHGFAFVPPGALAGKVKLRPWAKLEIDASNVPAQLHSKCQLRILWKNNFAGSLPSYVEQKPRRTDNPFGGSVVNDPFATPAAAPPDWRFHNYVTRSQTVEIVDQTVTVPPGEVTLVLDVRNSESNESTGMPLVTLGIVRTTSNQSAEVILPTFGSAQGQFVGDVSFPNWGRASDQATRIIAMPVRAADVPPPRDPGQLLERIQIPASRRYFDVPPPRDPGQLLAGMPSLQDSRSDPFAAPNVAQQTKIADAHARYFASAEGTAVRTSSIGIAIAATDERGKFTFDALPTGEYDLRMMPPDGMKGTLSGYEAAQGLVAVGSDSPDALRFDVKANELTELGSVAWTEKQVAGGAVISDDGKTLKPTAISPENISPAELSSDSGNPPNPNQFAAAAQARIEAALNKPVENIAYNGMPLQQVIEGLSDDMNIPIILNTSELKLRGFSVDAPVTLNLPPVTLRSMLNLALSRVSRDGLNPAAAQASDIGLTFVIRDEVLLITTREDAAKNPGIGNGETPVMSLSSTSATAPAADDHATEIVERWLQSAPQNADRSELKQLLETHLSTEFDMNQKTRRAEIDLLQQLLEQSRIWLDQRQQQRDTIIQGRVQELLK